MSDLLEAILKQAERGRRVSFDDDIGPDFGVDVSEVVWNREKVRAEGRHVKRWLNSTKRLLERHDDMVIVAMIEQCGRELDRFGEVHAGYIA